LQNTTFNVVTRPSAGIKTRSVMFCKHAPVKSMFWLFRLFPVGACSEPNLHYLVLVMQTFNRYLISFLFVGIVDHN